MITLGAGLILGHLLLILTAVIILEIIDIIVNLKISSEAKYWLGYGLVVSICGLAIILIAKLLVALA